MGCELCALVAGDTKTRLYYKDETCTIVDCLTCQVPMAVLSHHGSASKLESELMLEAVNLLFNYESIRTEPRRVPGHEHWHVLGTVK